MGKAAMSQQGQVGSGSSSSAAGQQTGKNQTLKLNTHEAILEGLKKMRQNASDAPTRKQMMKETGLSEFQISELVDSFSEGERNASFTLRLFMQGRSVH